jgi:predicted transcriptional regulator
MRYSGYMAEQYEIEKIRKIGKALDNKYRIEIIKLCAKEEFNITDLQKKVNIAYPHVHKHVHILKDADLIDTYEKTDSRGKNLMIKSKYTIKDKLLEKIQ